MKNDFFQRLSSEKPVLVDFYATWCGPCRQMAPVLDELKWTLGDSVDVLKVDVDKNPSLSTYFQIQGVPTLILFKKGQPLWRQSGVVSLPVLQSVIQKQSHTS